MDLTKPAPKELIVVEPLGAMVKSEVPVEEAITNGFVVGAEDVPITDKVAIGEVVPIPTLPPFKYESPEEVI